MLAKGSIVVASLEVLFSGIRYAGPFQKSNVGDTWAGF